MKKKRKDSSIYTMTDNEFIVKKRRTGILTYYNIFFMSKDILYTIASRDAHLSMLLSSILKLIEGTILPYGFEEFLNGKDFSDVLFKRSSTYRWRSTEGFNKLPEETRITNRQIILRGVNPEDIEKFLMVRELKK